MSGTKSPSPKVQATDVIVVSHGQPSDPAPAEADLAELTARIGDHLQGWQLHSATLAGPGALNAALDACKDPPLIYPHWHQGQFGAERFSAADRALHDGNPAP